MTTQLATGFLTLRDPETTAAEQRASLYRSLHRIHGLGDGFTAAELLAHRDARLASHPDPGILVDDRLVSETTVARTEAA